MNAVFLDTVGLIALWDASDQWHHLAAKAFEDIRKAGRPMVTTTFVLLECGNAASRRPYRQAVHRLWEQLSMVQAVIRPTETDETAAWAAYRQGTMGDAGIVDHVSFVVMNRLGLERVFTNDRHFRMAGFETSF